MQSNKRNSGLEYKEYFLDTTGDSSLRLYLDIKNDKKEGTEEKAIIIICPGGGFAFLSDREMEPVARRFIHMGFHAAVLNYGTGRRARNGIPMLDAAKAVRLVRENAKKWKICRNKVMVCGFSAGGYVAASIGTNWNNPILTNKLGGKAENYRPDALILGYPLINLNEVNRRQPYIPDFSMANPLVPESGYVFTDNGEKFIDFKKLELSYLTGKTKEDRTTEDKLNLLNYVDKHTPPVFIWHTSTDNLVWASNSIMLAARLEDNKIPYELHIFGTGYHGISLADETTADANGNGIVPQCQCWPELACRWVRENI